MHEPTIAEQFRDWLLRPVTHSLAALGRAMTALDDALTAFAAEATTGFDDLHTMVSDLQAAVAAAGSGADQSVADAAAKVAAATNALHDQFASFTQSPDVPVEPVPSPDPIDDTPVDTSGDDGSGATV